MSALRTELSVATTELERGDDEPLIAYELVGPGGAVLDAGVLDPGVMRRCVAEERETGGLVCGR